ncbi:MAG: DUF4388 domain-containing protein [Candidatus Obscuribacterales bacterium]|nr:DUF4388 domain-containing protein [Candidatus Obscuribacterales bacterium]
MVAESQDLQNKTSRKAENIIVLRYGPDLLSEIAALAKTKRMYDAIIVDATLVGYLFPAEILIESNYLAQSILEMSGALIFLKSDKAVAMVRESLSGLMSFHVFDNHAQLFDYSASLTKFLQAALGESTSFLDESTDLSHQILMSSIPVLTPVGLERKLHLESHHRRNLMLTLVDNYTPVAGLINKANNNQKIDETDSLERLRELEAEKLIYPLFPRIPFLSNCFKNQTAFSLKDYFLAAGLLTRQQLDDLLMELNGMPVKQKIPLGALAVKRNLLNARALEIATQDLAFYGQTTDRDKEKVTTSGEEDKVQSMVGHLGSIDPSNLLQNLATNRESGVLSVEYREMQFRAIFETGKITHAKLGKLLANHAVIEFASNWKQGIFVFIQRTPPQDLAKDNCKIGKALDKLLLDAALAGDNAEVTWKKLPKGPQSVLEKKPDPNNLMDDEKLEDPKEKYVLNKSERAMMKKMWGALDGLHPIAGVIRNLGDVTTADAAMAIDRLLHYDLVTVPQVDLNGPLSKFQQLVKRITETITVQRSEAFLRLSLRDTLGYSGRARVFILSRNADVGVDMAAARSAGTSLSQVLQDIEDWQVKYIEYASQELDRNQLMSIIREVHKG